MNIRQSVIAAVLSTTVCSLGLCETAPVCKDNGNGTGTQTCRYKGTYSDPITPTARQIVHKFKNNITTCEYQCNSITLKLIDEDNHCDDQLNETPVNPPPCPKTLTLSNKTIFSVKDGCSAKGQDEANKECVTLLGTDRHYIEETHPIQCKANCQTSKP